jgi:hypothetical protein
MKAEALNVEGNYKSQALFGKADNRVTKHYDN